MKTVKWLFIVIAALLLPPLVVVSPLIAQETTVLPLSEAGPYAVGTRILAFTDESRNMREIDVTVWYPSVEDARDAAPDRSGAPYPAIVYSHGGGDNRNDLGSLTSHLASYGFVVVAASHLDIASRFFIDRPLDVVFVMHQLANLTDSDLAGLIDFERLGVMGWSLGSTTALQMGGMRADWPANLEAGCAYHPNPAQCITDWSGEDMLALLEQFGARDENGLWYVPSDLHIRAVAGMALCLSGLFGERGLEAATVPALLMHGTADRNPACGYEEEGVYIYNHYGAADRTLISFIGGSHSFPLANPRVDHFLTAFFGYYLQGREDYAQYLTADYVNGIDGLAWGPYGVDIGAQGTEPITLDNAGRVQQLAVLDNQSAVYSIAWNPDGETLVSGDTDGRVCLWDTATGEMLTVLEDRRAFVPSVAFSPDGHIVATGSGYGDSPYTVRLLDAATGEVLTSLEGFDNPVYSVAFSPDGAILATGGGDPMVSPGSFQLWDVATGELLTTVEPRDVRGFFDSVGVSSLAFSPDGTLLATVTGDGSARLWDVATGQEHAVLGETTGYLSGVAFSSDGTKLASGSRLWDVATGELLTTLEEHTGEAHSVAFSPDRHIVATGGDDGVGLWNVATGTLLAVLEGHTGGVSGVTFSADGTTLATAGWDGTVRLWGVPAGA